MSVTPLETLLAHKVINLAAELSGAEKRVAGALIDHFNRRTGQCDPSLNTLADLIGMSRRTVMRAVARLERLSFFRKVRHGGKFHRNSYEPIWSSFREAEDRWNSRRKFRQQKFGSLNVSPSAGPTRHPEGDGHGHQTYSSNPLYRTLAAKRHEGSAARAAPVMSWSRGLATKLPRKEFEASNPRVPTTSSANVARIAAERRWSDNLRCELSTKVAVYGAIVDFIDEPLRIAATEAELNCRGAGLRLVLQRYRDSAAKMGDRGE
ncbi:hypothetical protein C7G42_14840 [Bradyrhizobium sp. MOS003]|nr:hypothetical protein C7G42_14840 [Bradyrhizobium sp. MOS003]QDP22736.1 helix-turn-helix domain-containing protein [Bradyrhizobium cosmicum]